jgi:hypothetical protein
MNIQDFVYIVKSIYFLEQDIRNAITDHGVSDVHHVLGKVIKT